MLVNRKKKSKIELENEKESLKKHMQQIIKK
jgi:hypothetical protein